MVALQVLQAAYRPLDLLALRRRADGRMEAAADGRPAWCTALGKPGPAAAFDLETTFPFLSVFLPDAVAWWAAGEQTPLRSGVWEEQAEDGTAQQHLDALALTLNGDALLLIGPLYLEPERLRAVLQKARNLHLDHEALERAQHALAASQARQARILAALPDTYALFDRHGHLAHHNDPGLPEGDAAHPLHLARMLGPDAAAQVLERAFAPSLDPGKPLVWEADRALGAAVRTDRFQVVYMDAETRLVTVRNIGEERELERRKAEFLAVAGHELRTPLTAVKGGLKMLMLRFADTLPEAAVHLLQVALRNSERLVALVGDLLDLQRIETATRPLDRRPLDARAVAARAVEDNAPFAQDLGRRIAGAITPEACYVPADEAALLQVLTNLLSNAVKFSPPGAEVRLALTCDAQGVCFHVHDQGPGIAPAYLDRLFQRFARIPGGEQAPVKGSGLGLSICKALVDAHHGRLEVDTAEGRGSVFRVHLPRVAAPTGEESPK